MRLLFIAIIVGLILLFGLLWWYRPIPVPVAPPPIEITPRPNPESQVIGRSVEGRAIEAYTYRSANQVATPSDPQKHLVFVGGIHGGYEWNSVLLAQTFMDYLEAHLELIPDNLLITIIPAANPDGVYRVVGKEGRFTAADVSTTGPLGLGRFNANEVDLNRNFDCRWRAESTWREQTVSAGTAPFSEPESRAIRDFVLAHRPTAMIFWHSQANAVYASACEDGILPETRAVMKAYSQATGYPAIDSFDSYSVTGGAEDWLASIGVPAITVELKTHETVEWEKNLLGIKALLEYYK